MITGQQEHAIATSAMAMKERGLVPSVSAILASCPQATLNPETDEPFSAKVILRVFKTKCYDQDPEHPWNYDHPKQKSTLSPEAMGARLKWSDDMLEINHQADWYFRHIAWVDPCYTIVPGRPKTIQKPTFFNTPNPHTPRTHKTIQKPTVLALPESYHSSLTWWALRIR